MAIVPTQTEQLIWRPNPIVTIAEYARYVGFSECVVQGVSGAPNETLFECREIWTLDQRNYISQYLSEAQEEIEDEIGYLLSADWIVGNIASERDSLERYVDMQDFRSYSLQRYGPRLGRGGVYDTRWNKIVALGTRAETDIEASATVDHTSDPAVVVVNTAITDLNEIKVFYAGRDLEIHPSEIIADGVTATISIPRCRLVNYSQLDNPSSGWDYSDLSNFATEVDVRRVYTDTAGTQVTINCFDCDCGDCGITEYTGCARVVDEQMGVVSIDISNLSCACSCVPKNVGLHYYAGDIKVTQKSKEVVVRLAHAKMPNEPCGCEISQRLWKRDRKEPEILTRERANNPFGINDGSWVAWKWTQTMKHRSVGFL